MSRTMDEQVTCVNPIVNTMTGRCDLEINGQLVLTLWAPKDFAKFQMVVWTAQQCMMQELGLAHTLLCVREHAE